MDVLSKIVSSLSQKQYVLLLEKIGGAENHKNFITLERIRHGDNLKNISTLLGISIGAFNTHRSRLLKKVSEHIGSLQTNQLSLLKEETARISHIVLQNDREISLRILYDMEARLKKYDLANELSIIYKLLARLHRFYPEFEHYEMLYKKYVAFALAVTKAEDLLYGFIYNLSHYYLNNNAHYKKDIEYQLTQLENFSELYSSHRLYVIYTIAEIYYNCSFLSINELKLHEIETEEKLHKIDTILNKYTDDEFYQNISNTVPYLFFEYYANINNPVKANHYLEKINTTIPKVSNKQLWPFFITQMINSIVSELLENGNTSLIFETHHILKLHYRPNKNEVPHYISFYRFSAIIFYLNKQYKEAAKTINDIRNNAPLKNYPEIDAELKLFLSFLYALLNDEDLANRYLASTKRLVLDNNELKPVVKAFGKVVTLILKHKRNGKEKENILLYWKRFNMLNQNRLLFYITKDSLVL